MAGRGISVSSPPVGSAPLAAKARRARLLLPIHVVGVTPPGPQSGGECCHRRGERTVGLPQSNPQCNIKREWGCSIVVLEGTEGIPLSYWKGKRVSPCAVPVRHRCCRARRARFRAP